MQKEKLGGYVGLGLFFLFPLVGLLQMRDGDEALRTAVGHARPSVVPLYVAGETNQPVACALVLQKSPLRAVVTGRVGATPLVTPVAGGVVTWRPVCEDALGEFAVLEGEGPKTSLAVAMTGPGPRPDTRHLSELVPIDPASFGDLEPSEEAPPAVVAALVSPPQLAPPLWIGELQVERAPNGRPSYRGSALRPLRGSEAIASAQASVPPTVHPALVGAPFVSRDGVVLALYAGLDAGAPRAVPMTLIREALLRLERTGS